jgi:hypothetical protein
MFFDNDNIKHKDKKDNEKKGMGDMVGSRQKFLILLLLFTMTISLTSCGNSEPPTTTIEEQLKYHNEDSAEGRSARILKCLSEGDKETLKDMFSPKAKRRKRLDKEIDKAMEFFEGRVEKYFTDIDGGDEIEVDKGKTTFYSKSLLIRDIQTDAGKTYTIFGLYYRVNDKDPESIGLRYLSIFDITGREYITGSPSVDIGN